MVDIKLDPETNDIQLVNDTIILTPTIQENINQRVHITLSTNRGDWDYNIEFGVPYFKNPNNDIQILGKTNKSIVDAWIQNSLLDIEGVIAINSYTSTWEKPTGKYLIEFDLEIEDGEALSGTASVNT